MGRIYLPNASQFDLMNENLAKIANAIASENDISTWAGIQKAVRIGVAPDLFPVGSQLSVNHNVYGTHMYDVVAHNYFKSAHDKNAHTMTLMCHDVLGKLQFDAPEALYYVTDDLTAGTYNFKLTNAYSSWKAGTYYFTLTETVPAGGQLCLDDINPSMPLEDVSIVAYRSSPATGQIETAGIYFDTSGTSPGTSLGTLGVELNHAHRVANGSNNYKESAIRQFLNSSAVAGSVWSPQTKFDLAPSWKTTTAGFMAGLDADFLAVVGEVVVPCSANNTYESPDSTTTKGGKYTVTDKFYLASQREIFGTTTETIVDDSVLFPYYDGATNVDRIKYRDGIAAQWWLRSNNSWNAYYARGVTLDGNVQSLPAYNSYSFAPVCTIV